jgi:hypothetical protein
MSEDVVLCQSSGQWKYILQLGRRVLVEVHQEQWLQKRGLAAECQSQVWKRKFCFLCSEAMRGKGADPMCISLVPQSLLTWHDYLHCQSLHSPELLSGPPSSLLIVYWRPGAPDRV